MRKNSYQIIFLLGVMRSGTTYFRNLLSSNPNILAFPGELNEFWTKYGGAPCGTVPNCPSMDAENLKLNVKNRVVDFFANQYKYRNHLNRMAYRIYRKIRYGNDTVVKNGVPFYILNKSTHMINKILYLNAIFPESKFIYILRDIFSQANSMKEHLNRMLNTGRWEIEYSKVAGECWSFHPTGNQLQNTDCRRINFEEIPHYWIEQNTLATRVLNRIGEDRRIFVNYTNLVNDPWDVIQRVENFLETKFLKENISFKLVNNLTSDPLNEWRERLSKNEIKVIKRVIDTCLDDYQFIWSQFSDSENQEI